MLRLYLRFYLALVASLVVFVIATVTVWHFMGTVPDTVARHAPMARRFHVMLVLLALSIGIGAYPVVRQMNRRLERLQQGVESLGAGDLSARVLVEGHDEVARLARSFNKAASQIEQLVQAHKSLLANASHELRTPLTRIRLAVELLKDSTDAKHRVCMQQDIAELDRLVDEILLASRLDAVSDDSARQEVDLLALAAEECARYDTAHLEGAPGVLQGEPRLLRRLVRNLLENAAHHGLPPTQVRVAWAPTMATVTVWDGGAGVPVGEAENVFLPFYHRPGAEAGRTGTGLGLALVRQIARRHGGDARCLPMDDGRSCFVVTLRTA